jgi:protein involved in polysaccharide export with SLBB domain
MSRRLFLDIRYMVQAVCGVAAVLAVGVFATAEAQDRSLLEKLEERQRLSTSAVEPVGVALESTVDPEKYYVGPSDGISVNIWVSPPINLTLTVTPEGTLIIPTVGEVRVADLLLVQAKERIISEVRKKYIAGQVTATLVRPRPIIVTVLGNVQKPGLYTLAAVDRATKALEEANRVAQGAGNPGVISYPNEMSTRNIILRHRDGTQERIDITKFLATKEGKWNPYLREGDVIVVPRKNADKNVFGIYGEVNAAGRYEFVQGDSVLDALNIAQGFTRLAIRDSVEFSRLNNDGTVLTTRIIDLKAIRDGLAPNLPLEPGDRLVVKTKLDLREDYRVYVGGEVVFPGVYPITKDKTKLSDVIRQAGGFTEFAWLEAAELNRRSVRPEDIDLERLVSLRGGVSAEDSAYYLVETDLRLRKEIVNVDFHKLFIHQDTTQDVILQSEDYIFVPSKKNTIYVFGQVTTAGHVPYAEGEGARYYIGKAGGYTDRARQSDVKIIKAKTRQWLSPGETTIEEGDYVWVPKEPDRTFAYYVTIYAQFAAIIGTVATLALLIDSLSK